MFASQAIEKETRKEIRGKIRDVIERYLKEGITIKQIKRYFRNKLPLSYLIEDIRSTGRDKFDSSTEYRKYVRKILAEVLLDMQAEIETQKMKKEAKQVIKYTEFEDLNESIDYSNLNVSYLFDNIGYATDDMDILASYFNTSPDYIEVKNKDYCLYEVTDFRTNVSRNNRTRTTVLLLADFQMEHMRDNVIRKVLNGVYEKIPVEVEYMGILVKPHTILNKETLKESVKPIVDKNIVDIVSGVTGYKFQEKYGNFYIWKKER